MKKQGEFLVCDFLAASFEYHMKVEESSEKTREIVRRINTEELLEEERDKLLGELSEAQNIEVSFAETEIAIRIDQIATVQASNKRIGFSFIFLIGDSEESLHVRGEVSEILELITEI